MEVVFVGLLVLFCLFGVHNKEQALDVLHTESGVGAWGRGRDRQTDRQTDRQAHRERDEVTIGVYKFPRHKLVLVSEL